MNLIDPKGLARRAFLQRTGQLAALGTAMPFGLTLAAMGEAAAQTASSEDYKALVCVFLFGGLDHPNTYVTYDLPSYLTYSACRGGQGEAGGGVAIPRANLESTIMQTDQIVDGRLYALHPTMQGLAALQAEGKVALQLNVGPLIMPLTRQQYASDPKLFPRPTHLFAHDHQVATWSSFESSGNQPGWLGRIGDMQMSSNQYSIFTSISGSGGMTLISGKESIALNVGNGTGGQPIPGLSPTAAAPFGSSSVLAALHQMGTAARSHTLENDYTAANKRAIEAYEQLSRVYTRSNLAPSTLTPAGMRRKLGAIARMIQARSSTGARRQVFFVLMGGYDVHDNLTVRQNSLLSDLQLGITAFQRHMEQLGISDKVTLFTASDFGRTMNTNATGSDHGWGGHHIIVGGAVKGKARYYGHLPTVGVSDSPTHDDFPGHVGRGRLLPSTSVEQYAATLGKWFGLSASQLNEILPNLKNFGGTDYPLDLGFL
jgi:uncharacterized protein (DUF1501 family)